MIPKIYILNLPSRTDRRDHMINLLEGAGILNFEFIAPVPADDELVAQLLSSNVISQDNNDVNKYKASHTITYMNLLRSANEDEFIIMEDDIGTDIDPEKLKESIEETILATPDDYDIIYLEYCHETCSFQNCNSCQLNKPLCTGATIWNKASAIKVANMFNNEMGNIDHWLANYIKDGAIKAYGPYPAIFYQIEMFGSDLPQDVNYFFRRSIFSDNNRACIQSEAIEVVSKIALAIFTYKLFR